MIHWPHKDLKICLAFNLYLLLKQTHMIKIRSRFTRCSTSITTIIPSLRSNFFRKFGFYPSYSWGFINRAIIWNMALRHSRGLWHAICLNPLSLEHRRSSKDHPTEYVLGWYVTMDLHKAATNFEGIFIFSRVFVFLVSRMIDVRILNWFGRIGLVVTRELIVK